MVPSTVNKSSSTNRRNEDILDRCELMKRGDLVTNGWCQAHKKTWYLMDGAELKKTWYIINGTEQNKPRVLLAGNDCDGVGRVKVCARTGS